MGNASTGSLAVLIDTNILVYAYDRNAGAKHQTALEVLSDVAAGGRMMVTAQVVNELYTVLVRVGRGPQMSHDKAHEVLSEVCATSIVLPLTRDLTFRALDAVSRHDLHFWDALIWAAAAENGVSVVYSEDFQHDQVIDGVRFCNPFS